MSLVRFTGHPLPDVGIATLCTMAGKRGPDELTVEDFDIVADELSANYFSGIMGSYLSCVFMNSEYVQPEPKDAEGKRKKIQTRKEYETRVLRAHRWAGDAGAAGLRCAFSQEPRDPSGAPVANPDAYRRGRFEFFSCRSWDAANRRPVPGRDSSTSDGRPSGRGEVAFFTQR